MAQLGRDPVSYTLAEIEQDWRACSGYALGLCLMVLQIIAESDDKNKIDYNRSADEGENIFNNIFGSVRKSEFYQWMDDLVSHYIERKMLEM